MPGSKLTAEPVDDHFAAPLPDGVSARSVKRSLIRLIALVVVAVLVIQLFPGLGSLRSRFAHASAVWIVAGAGLELLSTLAYVPAFREAFCTRMSWSASAKIALAEEGANSLLPVGGAGGLALGAWALRRGGMPAEEIARKSVAFFLLTSVPNVAALGLIGAGLATGVLPGHASLVLTLVPTGIAVAAVLATLAIGGWSRRLAARPRPASAGRLGRRLRPALQALGDGVEEALRLLRRSNPLLLAGIVGYLAFDVLVLWASFRALGAHPQLAIVSIAYIIGQLGNLVPLPGGIGGVEGGLIGGLVVYGLPAVISTAAVLIYRVLELWIPAAVGAVAFAQLRRLLKREADELDLCQPGQAVEVVGLGSVVPKPVSS